MSLLHTKVNIDTDSLCKRVASSLQSNQITQDNIKFMFLKFGFLELYCKRKLTKNGKINIHSKIQFKISYKSSIIFHKNFQFNISFY